MAQSKEMSARAKKLQGRPVCVTLRSGETYVGYITDVNSNGVVIAGAGARPRMSSVKKSSRSAKHRVGAHALSVRSGNRKSSTRQLSVRSRSRKRDAQVSAFMPMMGSMLGGLGGSGGLGGLGGAAGVIGGGMRLFGMFQKFVPVVKMGYGMIKSIRPFFGAVQGLMTPAEAAAQDNE
ncbi:hypothetical protein [Paenibacillus sp. QZ-Y1]|uniref:hypothetical protein n=1 Tax=Paenibacillus sp. QZ-Y1 TaxID=3414511 RepID=UPI003F790BF1